MTSLASTAPVLETPRLRLRPFRESDLDGQWAAMMDPDVIRFLGGVPATREETWRKVLASPGLWVLLGYGYWVAERLEDGAYLGQIGFADFKRDMTPSIEGMPEMGWIMAREAQGQGYATEAVLAALGLGRRDARRPRDRRHHQPRKRRLDPDRRERRIRSAARRPSTKASRSCFSGGRRLNVRIRDRTFRRR